jgi:hypothetical protein
MAGKADFLKLLFARQAEGMNKIEDKPDWLNEGADRGQENVFTTTILEATTFKADENSLQSHKSIENTGAVKNTAGDFANTANWNWRENKRNEDSRSDPKAIIIERNLLLEKADTLSLINTFIASQADRVQAYADYSRTFELLLANARLADYPMLVAEITSRFTIISEHILAVKQELTKRTTFGDLAAKSVAKSVVAIQEQEQEKLSVVAALHLDRIKEALPSMKLQLGRSAEEVSGTSMEHVSQTTYTKRRIEEIEQQVNTLMEEVMEVKCELLMS